jgi:hypothetical protein
MAATLTASSESAFNSWRSRFEGGPPLSPEDREEVAAYLMADLKPPRSLRRAPKAPDDHETRLIGAVVEHLWSAISQDLDGDWGKPMHVERDHFLRSWTPAATASPSTSTSPVPVVSRLGVEEVHG